MEFETIEQLHNKMLKIQESQPEYYETKADETINGLKTQSELNRLKLEEERIAFLQKVREFKNGK